MNYILATTMGESVELGAMALVALALIKVLDKAWDARTAKQAKKNGDDPLVVLAGLLEGQANLLSSTLEKLTVNASRQTDIVDRIERRMEKVERLLAILTDRAHAGEKGSAA